MAKSVYIQDWMELYVLAMHSVDVSEVVGLLVRGKKAPLSTKLF